jgi:hypothetical protein
MHLASGKADDRGAAQRLRRGGARAARVPVRLGQELGIMQHQRLRVEAEIGPVGADHAQRINAGGQTRQVAGLDGLQVMDMDVAALRRQVEGLAAALALALQEPSRFAGRVDVSVGLLPKESTLMLLHWLCSAAHRRQTMHRNRKQTVNIPVTMSRPAPS